MVSGYHAFAKRDNAKLGLAMDCGLAVAVLVMAVWYVFVPEVWQSATSGNEAVESFWLSWHPLGLVAASSLMGGFCGRYFHGVLRSWFSTMARVVVFLGLGFIALVILDRVQTIQRFRENQTGYLNRWVAYVQQAGQQQQELLSSLSAHERTLSTILEKLEIGSGIEQAIGALRDRLGEELDTLNNLPLGGRQQAAEIESARAHDLRAQGISPDVYIESLTKQKPGPELIGSQSGIDPLLRAQMVVLAAEIVEAGVDGGNARELGS